MEYCFKAYFPTSGKKDLLKFDTNKYVVLCATKLFADKPKWQTQEFLKEWQKVVRDDIHIGLPLLEKLVLTDMTLGQTVWFPSYLLSPNPQQRFKQIFQQQERWTHQQILPFLDDLLTTSGTGGVTSEQLLLQWTRCTVGDNGEKVYSVKEI